MPDSGVIKNGDVVASSQQSVRLRVGDLILDTGKLQLSRSGEAVELPRLSYRLFAALASAAPDVLTHEELIDRVWSGRVVSAETVTQRIKLVRQALGDDASDPRYIGLVRGQGYRMLQAVEVLASTEQNTDRVEANRSNGVDEVAPGGKLRLRKAYTVGLATLAAALLVYVLFVVQTERDPADAITLDSRSIAVLPFKNRSAAESDAFFVDGIHDDILTRLSKIDSLNVVSRRSVEQFRDTEKTIREIGQELGVAAILEGGIQRAGERIRVNVQLIDVGTDTHLWVDSFDEALTVTNVFSIQSEIANAIAQSMQTVLSIEEHSQIASVPTDNLAAYEAYLRGAQLLRRRTGATIEAAIVQFKEAIRHDSQFAAPYVGLADGYQLLPSYASRPAEVVLPLALAAADTAIGLDPQNGAAFASLAMIYFEAHQRRIGAIASDDPEPIFRHALKLSPNYATGYQWYGEYLAAADRPEEAAVQYERAAEIDPLSPILNHVYAHTLRDLGRFGEAEARFRKAIEIDPGFARAYQGLARFYFLDGRLADAALAAQQAILLNPTGAVNFTLLSDIYVQLGDDIQAARWLAEANRLQPDGLSSRRATTLMHLYHEEHVAAAGEALEGLARFPKDSVFLNVLKNHYLNEGKIETAIQLYEDAFPELFATDGPEVDEHNFSFAISCARVLQAANRHAEARAMLQRAQRIVDNHLPRNDNRLHLLRAIIHSLNADTQSALVSLRRAIDVGWRRYTFYHFEQDPNFDNIRNESEFQSMAAEVRADLAAQLQELQARTRAED